MSKKLIRRGDVTLNQHIFYFGLIVDNHSLIDMISMKSITKKSGFLFLKLIYVIGLLKLEKLK